MTPLRIAFVAVVWIVAGATLIREYRRRAPEARLDFVWGTFCMATGYVIACWFGR